MALKIPAAVIHGRRRQILIILAMVLCCRHLNNTTGTVTLYIDGVQIDQKNPDNGPAQIPIPEFPLAVLAAVVIAIGRKAGMALSIRFASIIYARTPSTSPLGNIITADQFYHIGSMNVGRDVHDESGNGITERLFRLVPDKRQPESCSVNANTPWYNGRSAKYGASLNFDGTDDYVQGTSATFPEILRVLYCVGSN